ncbi:hypothetical protein P4679_25950 [Priestia megaterium]|uniref:hypothetical protein n=1 Tax=Priestia megaterium TaxID=1404 RepID=UPI002E209225|nr:hypothetical protein [Priestia megaterium]
MKATTLRQSKRNKALDQLMELSVQHSDQDEIINKLTNVNKEALLLNKKEIEHYRSMQQESRELIRETVQEASYYKVPSSIAKDNHLPNISCYIVDMDAEEDELSDLELHCYIDIIEEGIRHFSFFWVTFVREAGKFKYNGFYHSTRGYASEPSETKYFDRFSSIVTEGYMSNIVEIVNSDMFKKQYENEKNTLVTLNFN